jgi:hypothetical protein
MLNKTKNSEIMTPLRRKLTNELKEKECINGEPNVRIYFDSSSAYYAGDNGFVYLESHPDIEDYIDENHKLESGVQDEGVGYEGVYWNNLDLNSPFHITDIEEKIETINV